MNTIANEGRTDRTIRIVAGILILAAGLFVGSWWGLIGLVPLLTGMAGWCPIYAMFSCSTVTSNRTGFQSGGGTL